MEIKRRVLKIAMGPGGGEGLRSYENLIREYQNSDFRNLPCKI